MKLEIKGVTPCKLQDEVNRLRGWLGKPTVTVENFRTAMKAKLAR